MAKLIYLDTCLSDYFQGFDGHVYAVPINSEDTYESVKETLAELIQHEEVYNATDSDYMALEEQCAELPDSSEIFCKTLEPYTDDSQDTVYAYFGVKLGKDSP